MLLTESHKLSGTALPHASMRMVFRDTAASLRCIPKLLWQKQFFLSNIWTKNRRLQKRKKQNSLKTYSSRGFSATSGWKNRVMPISNSPHPCSVSSNGAVSIVLAGSLKLGCSWKTTFLTRTLRSSLLALRTYVVHLCERLLQRSLCLLILMVILCSRGCSIYRLNNMETIGTIHWLLHKCCQGYLCGAPARVTISPKAIHNQLAQPQNWVQKRSHCDTHSPCP